MPTLFKDQSRLIDHFKRVYSLIVGLALTEACKRLLPIDVEHFRMSSLWMFLTLFVTIVPVFQGGDRFLDVTYFDRDLDRPRTRTSFMWDIYMLLLTALIFVGVALSIPPSNATSVGHLVFFYGLAILFFFDVMVLAVGYWKSDRQANIGSNYRAWIISNSLMGLACVAAALLYDGRLFSLHVALSNIAAAIFVCACIRTVFDYYRDDKFMFPQLDRGPQHPAAPATEAQT